MRRLEAILKKVYDVEYTSDAGDILIGYLETVQNIIKSNHFLKVQDYLDEVDDIWGSIEELSTWKSREDRLLQRQIQKSIVQLIRKILDENKKIFIVHGRNIGMRDKVSSLLGRLKLDYVILESEYNGGATIIEKFLRNAEDCQYAIVLFSADDVGGLKGTDDLSDRVRQNVILELGYFLGRVGRENLMILHEATVSLEKPSDYDGIVYEPLDDYGAWKNKLIKELRKVNVYIEQSLADRI